MSHEGKMHRGLKWWNTRGRDSVLSKEITDHKPKMDDVDYFMEGKDDLSAWCKCVKCKVTLDVEISKVKDKSPKGKKEVK